MCSLVSMRSSSKTSCALLATILLVYQPKITPLKPAFHLKTPPKLTSTISGNRPSASAIISIGPEKSTPQTPSITVGLSGVLVSSTKKVLPTKKSLTSGGVQKTRPSSPTSKSKTATVGAVVTKSKKRR